MKRAQSFSLDGIAFWELLAKSLRFGTGFKVFLEKRIMCRFLESNRSPMRLSFRPLSHALGAEVQGVDLGHPLSNFRDQRITREQHIAFSRRSRLGEAGAASLRRSRVGELDRHDNLPRDRHPGHQHPGGGRQAVGLEVHRPTVAFGHVVHPGAVAGSLLRGIVIPPVGGDTMFTNMYRAYDTLSDGMKAMTCASIPRPAAKRSIMA
ncbi:MAG: TauD/TfdA family dioxygenase [Reyranella sp.]|nr:TauD/TfdA family dioxygenase [Reyranella sp.]MBL6653099.1 TauD/TfdA family dioxygenase [Reyranella sp.]